MFFKLIFFQLQESKPTHFVNIIQWRACKIFHNVYKVINHSFIIIMKNVILRFLHNYSMFGT